ncbi:juvenile hormone epoxide hydrolase-like [Cydia strobilella]|uniref:juvenile hormone epoxide hydrolase-like n=1 Tax=Cydia strobilella TaxID=1100964 RepID=UPI003004522E
MMRVASFLLCLLFVASVACDDIETSPVQSFLETINKWRPVLKDIFGSVYETVNRVAFEAALKEAVNLMDQAYPAQPPPIVPERWWGENQSNDTSVREFTVRFTDEMITDLRYRINHRRDFTPALQGVANTYGTNSAFLAQFLEQWANEYDFKARERWLNNFPQYVTNIQGLDIHFIHITPPNPRKKVVPILMLHGFTVTAFEYVHVIQNLIKERDDSDFEFEIVVPNLPGYGYSEATSKPGLALYQMAIIMKNLMLRLGKEQFYIHAGDIGHMVGDALATLFPERVLGFHTNLPFSLRPQSLTKWVLGQLYPPAVVDARYESRMYPLLTNLQFYLEHFGYFHIQATKPDNLGHGPDESPVALTSWLLEPIMMGTNISSQYFVDGNLTQYYDMNDWFDTFTVYWSSKSAMTAMRSYAEWLAWKSNPLSYDIMTTPTPVLFAAINFGAEIIYMPDDLLRDKYPNLVQTTTLDVGGHFAAYLMPDVLANSIWTSVAKMEIVHTNQAAKS